jgi:DUF4097 and DUF4098 domain-containing protein YvlB
MKLHRAALAALALVSSAALAEESVDRRNAASPTGEVEVECVSGVVSISGWDRNEVHVAGTLGDGVERLDFETQGNRTIVKVVHKRRGSWDDDTELSVRIPKGSSLQAKTVSAELSVNNVTGRQELQSVSGDISTSIVRADADVSTVSGAISLRGEDQPAVVSVTTVSGDARVTRVSGDLRANSVSGSLSLVMNQVRRARAQTTSGDLELSGTLEKDGRIDAESISGEVQVNLRGKVDAYFDVESFSGDIDNCFGPEPQRVDKYAPGTELHFKEGDGSGRVRLQTLSGTITLCNK